MWHRDWFNEQVLLLAKPSHFTHWPKKNFYNGVNGHVSLCNANSKKPPMEIREIIGIDIVQVVLTNARVVFGDHPHFLQAQKRQFWSTFSTRFGICGWLVAHCVCVCVLRPRRFRLLKYRRRMARWVWVLSRHSRRRLPTLSRSSANYAVLLSIIAF